MNRIDRLSAILTQLQSKRRVTAQEIADRFDISLRSVYRDIKALQENGVPVIGEAGIGYSVMEGYRLPPVMFTNSEASALLLAGKLANISTDATIKKNFENALYKIKAVLRYTDKEQLEALDENVVVFPSAYNYSRDGNPKYLSELQQAIITSNVVTLQYRKPYDTVTDKRDIEPIGLCYYGNAWHCIAWCRLRNGYRDFKLSRIVQLQVKDVVFNKNEHPSINEYVNEVMRNEQQLQEIIITVNKESAKYVQEQKYYHGFISEEIMGDVVRMHFLSASIEYFARWILMAIDAINIEAPKQLQARVAEISKVLYQYYVSANEK